MRAASRSITASLETILTASRRVSAPTAVRLDIAISGSVSIVRRLLAAGLLDALHLLVHPIAVRTGMRLFDEGESPIPLRLVSARAFTTGVLHLIYALAESTPAGTYDEAKAHLPQTENG